MKDKSSISLAKGSEDCIFLNSLNKILFGYSPVGVLLAVYWLMGMSSSLDKCNTFDEIAHITAGYSYWIANDYRLNPENGNFPQRWMALPLLLGNYQFPSLDKQFWWSSAQRWVSRQFFYEMGNNPDEMLIKARAAVALIGVSLGLIVYLWSRKLFGKCGGLLSLFLFVFSPTMLAHGRLATSDITTGFFFITSTWAFWALLHKLSFGRLLLSCLSTAGLFLSKMSAGLFIPMVLAMLAIRLISNNPLKIEIISHRGIIYSRFRQYLTFIGVGVVHIAVVVVFIWASYGFRYAAMKHFELGRDQLLIHWEDVLEEAKTVQPIIRFACKYRLLPEGYLYGLVHVARGSHTRRAFFNGNYGTQGWRTFFPYCFAVKTPLGLFIILFFALTAAINNWQSTGYNNWRSAKKAIGQSFYRTTPLWVLLLIYSAAAIYSKINIGHRHILPIYPAIFILAGAAAWWVQNGKNWKHKTLIIIALLAFMGASIGIRPHYLAFFNLLVGGPSNGYKHFVDSSLDWGQDLPALKQWLNDHNPSSSNTPVYLSYLGTANIQYYGINARQLPGFFDNWRQSDFNPLSGGIYCISATMLQSVYNVYTPGRWTKQYEKHYRSCLSNLRIFDNSKDNPTLRDNLLEEYGKDFWEEQRLKFEHLRFARLCSYLRKRKPDSHVGYSILIYRLKEEDVKMALFGPLPLEN